MTIKFKVEYIFILFFFTLSLSAQRGIKLPSNNEVLLSKNVHKIAIPTSGLVSFNKQ